MPIAKPTRCSRTTHCLMAWFAATLTACGGGNGDAPAAPRVTAQPQDLSLPEGGEGTMSVTATSNAGAIAYEWFNVTRGTVVPGGVAAELDFGPVSFAAHGTQARVNLTNSVGTTASANATLNVVERAWSAPAAAVAAGARQVASVVDSNGHTHLVALTGNNVSAAVQARIKLRSNDSTLANDFTVPDQAELQASTALLSGRPAPTVSLAANNNGFVLAVWHINGAAWSRLFQPPTSTLPNGHWQAAVRISAATADRGVDPAVVAIGEDFEVVWRERQGTSGVHDIKAMHFDRVNNNWSPAVTLEARTTETEAPQIVADAAGNVLAAWRHVGEGVWSNRHAAGAAWASTLTQLVGSDLPLEALRANAAGKAVVVTSDRVGTGIATRLDLAAGTLIVSGGGRIVNAYGSAPAVAIDGSGRIQILGVSVNTTNGDSRLFRWWYDPQFSSWGGPEAVSDNVAGNFLATGNGVRDPSVSGSDAEGNFIVSWLERVADGDNPLSHLRARRFHAPLDAWRPIATIGDANNLPARVTMGVPGNATLVFGATSVQAVQAASLR